MGLSFWGHPGEFITGAKYKKCDILDFNFWELLKNDPRGVHWGYPSGVTQGDPRSYDDQLLLA